MHTPQPGMQMHPPPQGMPPPPVTNGYHNHQSGSQQQQQSRLEAMETEISQMPPPNLNEPPPTIVQNPAFPPPRSMMMINPMTGPPPPVLLSPPTGTPMFSTPTKEDQRQEQLEHDISNLSIREKDNQQVNHLRLIALVDKFAKFHKMFVFFINKKDIILIQTNERKMTLLVPRSARKGARRTT